jgi:uncharacterized protein
MNSQSNIPNNLNNDKSILAPTEIFQLFIVTFLFVVVFGTIALLVGGKILGLLSESLLILPAIILVWYQKRPFFRTFRMEKINPIILLYSFIISIVIFILGDELDRIISVFFPMPQIWLDSMQDLIKIHTVTDGIVLFITAVFLAGFAEEMLFRGMLQKTLEHYREPAHAIVLTSVFFALVHFNPWTAIQITLLGVALGYMAWKSQSILPSIILHGCNNLFSIILMNLQESSLHWYLSNGHVKVWLIVLALCAVVPLFLSFNTHCLRHNQQMGE